MSQANTGHFKIQIKLPTWLSMIKGFRISSVKWSKLPVSKLSWTVKSLVALIFKLDEIVTAAGSLLAPLLLFWFSDFIGLLSSEFSLFRSFFMTIFGDAWGVRFSVFGFTTSSSSFLSNDHIFFFLNKPSLTSSCGFLDLLSLLPFSLKRGFFEAVVGSLGGWIVLEKKHCDLDREEPHFRF